MMSTSSLGTRLLAGVAAGLAGTVGIHGLRTATGKWLPEAMPPMRQDPAEFMLERAGSALPSGLRERIPESAEQTAGPLLHLGYGTTSALIYAALRGDDPSVLRDGLLLGLGVWAAGYMGWLPRTGLMPPITKQRPAQVFVPLLQHVAFGLAAAAVYAALRRRLD
jgi:hypothetical protein